MTTKTTLSIPKTPADVPLVSPNLMPFQIAYSGPALISTYFMKKPFLGPGKPGEAKVESKSFKNEAVDASQVEGSTSKGVDEISTEKETSETRLKAAFRGRRVVSQSVQVPKGYTGLLLTQQASFTKEDPGKKDIPLEEPKKAGKVADAKAKAAARAKALKAKAAAKLKKGKARQEEDDEEEEENEDDKNMAEMVDEPVIPVVVAKQEEKVFQIAGKFDKFQVWNPDVPSEGTQDEYVRSLNEWITLAAEIHRI